MKKNIYLAQVNVTYSDQLAYLPYAAGCIAAYALADSEIRENFSSLIITIPQAEAF